jgi:CheY-like chemotaxis protein
LCADGQQAVETLKASPSAYDVVLMDIQMPVMDGIAATRALRSYPATAAVPVLALTAGVLPEERESALAAGMNEFLAKPIDLEQLVAKLLPYAPSPSEDTIVTPAGMAELERSESSRAEADTDEWPVIPSIDSSRSRLRFGTDRAFFLKMLGMFVEEFGGLRSELNAQLAAGDRESAGRRIHNLKGNAGNLGAIELMELAKVAETAIRDQQSDEAKAVERLQLALETLISDCRPCLSRFTSAAPAAATPGNRRLGELKTALRHHNLSALGLFAELEPAIAAACGATTAAAMASAIRHLEFEKALSELDAALRES